MTSVFILADSFFSKLFEYSSEIKTGALVNVRPRFVAIVVMAVYTGVKRFKGLLDSYCLCSVRVVKHDPNWRVPGLRYGLDTRVFLRSDFILDAYSSTLHLRYLTLALRRGRHATTHEQPKNVHCRPSPAADG